MFDKKALWESVKELLRTGLLAAIPVITDSVANGTFSWRVTLVAASVAAWRAIDRYLHENKNTKLNGLAPF